LKLVTGNDIWSVIACSNSLRLLEAARDAWRCTPRSTRLPRRTEVLCCIACQHQLGTTEKGGRKVGCSARGDCYSRPLHTLAWTEEENARPGEVIGGPWRLRVQICMQFVLSSRLAKSVHQRVRDVDEMAIYHSKDVTSQGETGSGWSTGDQKCPVRPEG
jgi:hypothetical protein